MADEEPVTHGETTNYNLRYPTDDAPIDTAGDIQRLAEDADDALGDKASTQELTDGLSDKSDTGHKHNSDYVPKTGGAFSGTVTGPLFSGTELQTQYKIKTIGNSELFVNDINNGSNARAFVACRDAINGAQAATYNQLVNSSREWKEQINRYSTDNIDVGMLEAFDKINPVRYRYKDEDVEGDWILKHLQGTEHVGFIAEEVKDAGLGVAETSEGKIVGLRNDELIAVLWSKVQQLEQRIADLEADDA